MDPIYKFYIKRLKKFLQNETVYMESDGKNIIFYIKFKRHFSLTGMNFLHQSF